MAVTARKKDGRLPLQKALRQAIRTQDAAQARSLAAATLESDEPWLPSTIETNKLISLLTAGEGAGNLGLALRTLSAMRVRTVFSYATVLRGIARSLERPPGEDADSRRELLVTKANTLFFASMLGTDNLTPDSIVCNCLLLVYANAGEWKKATEFLHAMPAAPTTASYNTVLKAHSKAQEPLAPPLGLAFDLLDEMSLLEDTSPNVVTFSTVISLCGKRADVQAAFDALQVMRERGLKPNARTHAAMIHACGRAGLLNEARHYLEAMSETPTVHCFTALIDAFGKENRLEDAFEIFASMGRRGVNPNVTTFSALIDAVAKAGDLDLAFHLFGSMARYGITPNEVTYSSLLSACARQCRLQRNQDLDRAFHLFQEAKLAGKLPSARTPYVDLLGALGRSGDVQKALKVFKEYTRGGRGADDEQMHTLLMDAAGRGGQFALVWEVFEDMNRRDLKPSTATFQALITACATAGDLLRACMVFNEMKRRGLPLDVAYNCLLTNCGKAGDTEAALSVFDGMKKAGIRPSVHSYSSLLHALSDFAPTDSQRAPEPLASDAEDPARDNLFRVFLLFSEMRNVGIEPNRVAYNTLIDACAKARDMDHAFQVYRSMRDDHVLPDVVTYSSLIQACLRCGDLERGYTVLGDLRSSGTVPSERIYTLMLKATCRAGQIQRAFDLLKTLRQDSLVMTPKMFAILIKGCYKHGDHARAGALLRLASSKGMGNHLESLGLRLSPNAS